MKLFDIDSSLQTVLYLEKVESLLDSGKKFTPNYRFSWERNGDIVTGVCGDISSLIRNKVGKVFDTVYYEGNLEFTYNRVSNEVIIKKLPCAVDELRWLVFTHDLAKMVGDSLKTRVPRKDIKISFARSIGTVVIDKEAIKVIKTLEDTENYKLLRGLANVVSAKEEKGNFRYLTNGIFELGKDAGNGDRVNLNFNVDKNFYYDIFESRSRYIMNRCIWKEKALIMLELKTKECMYKNLLISTNKKLIEKQYPLYGSRVERCDIGQRKIKKYEQFSLEEKLNIWFNHEMKSDVGLFSIIENIKEEVSVIDNVDCYNKLTGEMMFILQRAGIKHPLFYNDYFGNVFCDDEALLSGINLLLGISRLRRKLKCLEKTVKCNVDIYDLNEESLGRTNSWIDPFCLTKITFSSIDKKAKIKRNYCRERNY